MVDNARWIADYIKEHENTTQREFLEEAKKVLKKSDRTIRGYLARLDGERIRRVREGREVRLQSVEYWKRQEHHSFDLRVPHTEKLKTVLDMFRNQVPAVDELALRASYQQEYRPDMRLESEGHVLYDDLLFHLGLLKLRADPSAAWSEFKEQASRFIAARDALWSRCANTASEALGLPLGRNWTGQVISEHCVALLYKRALAVARAEKETRDPFRDAKVILVDGAMEYWLGGLGILRRRKKGAKEVDELKKEVTTQLRRTVKLAERSEFLGLADPVVDSLNHLRAVRESLVSALDEASYYEVFPGSCRFTGAGG